MDSYLNSHGLSAAFVTLLLVDRLHISVRWNEGLGVATLIHKVFTVRVQAGVLAILLRRVDSGLSSLIMQFLIIGRVEDMGVLFLQLLKHFGTVLRLR